MFTGIAITPMYVLNHEEALDFYCGKLGFEVDTDLDFGHMRWLTVGFPQDPGRLVLLQRIGDTTPTAGPDTSEMLRELTERGGSSWMILNTDDCHATYATLAERGVEIIEEPTERPYGIDMAIRDPFGNQIRITQGTEWNEGAWQ